MGKLIEKYKVSEKDIYTICFAKNKKLGFSKTVQIKNAILKPYKVKFLEQAPLEKEITETKSHENEELVKKYGEIDLSEFEKKSTNQKGSKVGGYIVIGVVVLFIFWIIGSIFGGGLDHDEIEKIEGKKWTFLNTANVMGCYMEANISLKITKTEEGYNYELTDVVWDGCSYAYTKDVYYTGKMKDEYTNWSGYMSWDPNYETTYWEFEDGGAAGDYAINVNDDGTLMYDDSFVELRYLDSEGAPTKTISSNN